jgi:hypothetical protein
MNFLVDAQLPWRMIAWLTAVGCNALDTLDLPDGNRTTDEQINDLADREQRMVVSSALEEPEARTEMGFDMRFVQPARNLPDWYEPIEPDDPESYQLTFGGLFEVAAMTVAGLLDEEAATPELPDWPSVWPQPQAG